ncbi:MAG: hypothetical protein IT241_03770 [Bacteroidia bacterium]|nr:hypothetical protein [Bacteroidia bacterium]
MKESFDKLHAEHASWQTEIKNLKAELSKCNDQLDELIMSKPAPELLVLIEHFQNQFTVQRNELDIMRHDFKQHENDIEAHQRGESSQAMLLDKNHKKGVERLNEYKRLFGELKSNFDDFLQKNFAGQD